MNRLWTSMFPVSVTLVNLSKRPLIGTMCMSAWLFACSAADGDASGRAIEPLLTEGECTDHAVKPSLAIACRAASRGTAASRLNPVRINQPVEAIEPKILWFERTAEYPQGKRLRDACSERATTSHRSHPIRRGSAPSVTKPENLAARLVPAAYPLCANLREAPQDSPRLARVRPSQADLVGGRYRWARRSVQQWIRRRRRGNGLSPSQQNGRRAALPDAALAAAGGQKAALVGAPVNAVPLDLVLKEQLRPG